MIAVVQAEQLRENEPDRYEGGGPKGLRNAARRPDRDECTHEDHGDRVCTRKHAAAKRIAPEPMAPDGDVGELERPRSIECYIRPGHAMSAMLR